MFPIRWKPSVKSRATMLLWLVETMFLGPVVTSSFKKVKAIAHNQVSRHGRSSGNLYCVLLNAPGLPFDPVQPEFNIFTKGRY